MGSRALLAARIKHVKLSGPRSAGPERSSELADEREFNVPPIGAPTAGGFMFFINAK